MKELKYTIYTVSIRTFDIQFYYSSSSGSV